MKVFLSWSGETSQKIAILFRDWLPNVIQSIKPYVSSEDIGKGTRWFVDIAKELEDSYFGILCITKENLNKPWLMFEAGALSKAFKTNFVAPFLFDFKNSTEIPKDNPISQFQSTIFEKDDIKRLITTINNAYKDKALNIEILEKAFDMFYPKLEEGLLKIEEEYSKKPEENQQKISKPSPEEILEEILELTRNNQKLLRNPEINIAEEIKEIRNYFNEIKIMFSNYYLLNTIRPIDSDSFYLTNFPNVSIAQVQPFWRHQGERVQNINTEQYIIEQPTVEQPTIEQSTVEQPINEQLKK